MSTADNRGVAVSEVALRRDGTVDVRGTLRDGRPIAYTLSRGVGPRTELVGQIEPPLPPSRDSTEGAREAYFVKAMLASGELLLCHVDGFAVKYHTISSDEAQAIFLGRAEAIGVATRRRQKRKASARKRLQRARKVLSIFYSVRAPPHSRQTGRSPGMDARACSRARGCEPAPLISRRLPPVSRGWALPPRSPVQPTSDEAHAPLATQPQMARDRRALVAAIFEQADRDHTGALAVEDVRTAMARDASFLKLLTGPSGRPVDAEQLFNAMDLDGDGKVRLEEMQLFCADGLDALVFRLGHALARVSTATRAATDKIGAAVSAHLLPSSRRVHQVM